MTGHPRPWPPPCLRCGRDGQILPNHKTPTRMNGARWGFAGGICHGCYESLRQNPNAQLQYRKPVTLAKLADAALAVCYGLDSERVEELQRRVAVLRRLAEAAVGMEA